MCDPATAIAGSGAVSGISSLIGGGLSAQAAQSAASTQAAAAEQAAQLQYQAEQQALGFQEQQYATTQQNVAPYLAAGQFGINTLATPANIASLTQNPYTPFSQTAVQAGNTYQLPQNLSQLAQTPGYQFTLQQGLESTQNSFAGQGLARSGAAMKGATNYAEGLASTTYQQQFQNYLNANTLQGQLQGTTNQQQLQLAQGQLSNQQQIYNMFAGLAQTGGQAALGQGQIGTQLTGQQTAALQAGATGIGQGITGAAAASAAGTVGATNAITNALGGIGGAGSNTALLLALNQAGMFGGQAAGGGGFQQTQGYSDYINAAPNSG